MSQEKQMDDYPEKYVVIMSTSKGIMGSASVGAHSREACIIGMHDKFPNVVLTIHPVKS